MSTAAEKCAPTIVVATDTVTTESAPASAATLVMIVQVAPARAIAMATAFATTINAIATPDSGERIVAMRFVGPIVCMVNALTTNVFVSKVSLDGIVTPALVVVKLYSIQKLYHSLVKEPRNLFAVGTVCAPLITDVNVIWALLAKYVNFVPAPEIALRTGCA